MICADYLVTGAGGHVGGVSDTVVRLLVADGARVRAFVHRDEQAAALKALGAEVAVGDLTDPDDVVTAMRGVTRVFFNMGVSSAYLEATAVLAAVGRDHGGLETVVNMSQMTVSQMSMRDTGESRQHRLHWLGEQVLDWSGLPVTHVRPTVFMDNPLFTFLNAERARTRHELALPFGNGRSSPIAASDVAHVVATLLTTDHHQHVYELTGPQVLDRAGLAGSFSDGLGVPVTGIDLPHDTWRAEVLAPVGLPAHVEQHIDIMARLHRQGRYDRLTDTLEQVTGRPALAFAQYITQHPEKFGG